MALLWKRIQITSELPVEEVQRRLAKASADWDRRWRGRGVPSPPWQGSDFVACQGMVSLWLSIPLVVTGTVRATGNTTAVAAVIRPHAWEVALLLLGTLWLPAGAVAARAPIGMAVAPLLMVGCVATSLLWVNLTVKCGAIEEALVAACQPAGAKTD